ncbi:hypothetical protein Syun_006615 [Stephania yunnanensis]|uniref:Uncharacterized protein n=1 Tax=Stephania yunnanensis TaxID=152371 RepID=A0AAP0L0C3_9MAGN
MKESYSSRCSSSSSSSSSLKVKNLDRHFIKQFRIPILKKKIEYPINYRYKPSIQQLNVQKLIQF